MGNKNSLDIYINHIIDQNGCEKSVSLWAFLKILIT